MNAIPMLNHHLTGNENQPVILYLHGFLGCGQDFDDIVTSNRNDYAHLTVDLPGHGAKPPAYAVETYQMAPTAELIISLLDRLQIKQCHLIAYSMGGRLGLYLLTHYPNKFTRAVIESASPGLKTDRERQARRLADRQVGHDLATKPFDQFLKAWYTQPLFLSLDQTDPRFKALLDRRLQSDPVGLSASLEQMGTGTQPPLWDSLKNTNQPVLFMAGERDAKYRALAIEMAGLCPRGRTAIIQGAGHNVHFERPKEYSAEVTKFFGKTE